MSRTTVTYTLSYNGTPIDNGHPHTIDAMATQDQLRQAIYKVVLDWLKQDTGGKQKPNWMLSSDVINQMTQQVWPQLARAQMQSQAQSRAPSAMRPGTSVRPATSPAVRPSATRPATTRPTARPGTVATRPTTRPVTSPYYVSPSQSAYAQPAYAQPAYAQPAYAQPAYAQPQPAYDPSAMYGGGYDPSMYAGGVDPSMYGQPAYPQPPLAGTPGIPGYDPVTGMPLTPAQAAFQGAAYGAAQAAEQSAATQQGLDPLTASLLSGGGYYDPTGGFGGMVGGLDPTTLALLSGGDSDVATAMALSNGGYDPTGVAYAPIMNPVPGG